MCSNIYVPISAVRDRRTGEEEGGCREEEDTDIETRPCLYADETAIIEIDQVLRYSYFVAALPRDPTMHLRFVLFLSPQFISFSILRSHPRRRRRRHS